MNPWKEVVTTAHEVLNRSNQVATPIKPQPLVMRIIGLLQELEFARDLVQTANGNLRIANQQLERQAKTIADLQPKPQVVPVSETPPPVTNDQLNARIIEEGVRRARVARRKKLS